MIDIKAIREAAEAATQGGWITSDNSHIYSAGLQLLAVAQHCRDKEANAKHIATADPATVIALCDEIERLRADAARYQWLRDAHNTGSSRWAVVETSQGDWTLIEQAMGYPDQNLDAAIDIAMRDEK